MGKLTGAVGRWVVSSVAVAALYFQPLWETAWLTLGRDEHHSHIGLIPFIFLYLIWSLRKRLFTNPLAERGQFASSEPAIQSPQVPSRLEEVSPSQKGFDSTPNKVPSLQTDIALQQGQISSAQTKVISYQEKILPNVAGVQSDHKRDPGSGPGNRDRTGWAALPGAGALVVAGAAFALSGELTAIGRLSLFMTSFVLAYWAAFVYALGLPAARAALFPLGFLLFMIPIPAPLLQAITDALLWGSAWMTDWMFALTGTPVFRQDYTFRLPGVAIEIAEQCSGIRSTLALVITGLLAGYFMLRRPWSRLLLVLFLFPLSVFKNGLRIVTLTLLSIHVDPGFLDGDLHHSGGIVFFLITLVLMGGVLEVLRRLERGRGA